VSPLTPKTVLGYIHVTVFFRTTDTRCQFVGEKEKAAFQLSRLITAKLMSDVMFNFRVDNFFYPHWTTNYESRLYLVVDLSLHYFQMLANRKLSKAVTTVY